MFGEKSHACKNHPDREAEFHSITACNETPDLCILCAGNEHVTLAAPLLPPLNFTFACPC